MTQIMPLFLASAQGLCPQCGARTLFAGESGRASILSFAPRCSACGLDRLQSNVGDGPAAFLILIVGAIVTTLAVVTEVKLHPPFWLHILLWLPLTLVAVVASLRVAKGALLHLEYQHKAREGTLVASMGPHA